MKVPVFPKLPILAAALFFMGLSHPVYVQSHQDTTKTILPRDRISTIVIRGYQRIPASVLRRHISIRIGDVYDPAKVERSVKALRNTGYFDKVRAEVSDDPEGTKGGTVVIFSVEEKQASPKGAK